MGKSHLKDKTVAETAINDHTYRIFPHDLNSLGTVFGGIIMGTLDRLCLVVAERHSERTCVTASVDAMHFLGPAGQGDNLIFMVSVNRAWNTSMEVGAKVIAEDKNLQRRHILSAYFTFVALDEQKNPTAVPQVITHTKIEKRRFHEAEIRRKNRIKHAEELKTLRGSFQSNP